MHTLAVPSIPAEETIAGTPAARARAARPGLSLVGTELPDSHWRYAALHHIEAAREPGNLWPRRSLHAAANALIEAGHPLLAAMLTRRAHEQMKAAMDAEWRAIIAKREREAEEREAEEREAASIARMRARLGL